MNSCCEIGTYECSEYVFTEDDKDIYVDRCLVGEIKDLIDSGITTLGCCCGHSKVPGYIQVDYDSVSKMIALGYKRLSNPFGSYTFFPKTQCPNEVAE